MECQKICQIICQKDMPDRMPDGMPEDMPEHMPEDMPEDMPEHLPVDMPEHLPEDMPGRMPEDMPDRMPDRMPENMSDRMPEDLPVTKCINVMVGITRSKVILWFLMCWSYVVNHLNPVLLQSSHPRHLPCHAAPAARDASRRPSNCRAPPVAAARGRAPATGWMMGNIGIDIWYIILYYTCHRIKNQFFFMDNKNNWMWYFPIIPKI